MPHAESQRASAVGDRCPLCAAASVLVIVPCHNEAATIADVVARFRAALPEASVVVADNASDDDTAEIARRAGADVVGVPAKGKGRAVRALFERSDHDVTILVDGDSTYDPSAAPALVHRVFCTGYDLVNVSRVSADEGGEYRAGHQLGNAVLTSLQRTLTGIRMDDILTGYKAMSRRFVASLPVRSSAFQVEVEIAAHAVNLDFAYCEVSAPYAARPAGSVSKLSTYRDGWAILRSILRLYRDDRPLPAFTFLSIPWLVVAVVTVGIALSEYWRTGASHASRASLRGWPRSRWGCCC